MVECGVQPDYFMNRMQWYEVEACLKGLENKNKAGWEQARFISYVTAQVNTTKKLRPTDVLTFLWDKEEVNTDTSIASNDILRLKDKANQTLKLLR